MAQTTKTKLKPKSNQQEYKPKYGKSHMIIPVEDMAWAIQQSPSIHKLWSQCWICDPYGSRWIPLNTTLSRSAFMEAKRVLSNAGLFVFKSERSIRDSRERVCWMVRNLHGARVTNFWLESTNEDTKSTNEDIKSTHEDIESANLDSIDPETIENTRLSETLSSISGTSQEHLKDDPEMYTKPEKTNSLRSSSSPAPEIKEIEYKPIAQGSPAAVNSADQTSVLLAKIRAEEEAFRYEMSTEEGKQAAKEGLEKIRQALAKLKKQKPWNLPESSLAEQNKLIEDNDKI